MNKIVVQNCQEDEMVKIIELYDFLGYTSTMGSWFLTTASSVHVCIMYMNEFARIFCFGDEYNWIAACDRAYKLIYVEYRHVNIKWC